MRPWMKLSGLVVMLITTLMAFADPAYSDCNGQFAPGQVCGASGPVQAPPSASLLSPLLDRNFGAPSPQGTILNRGAPLWSATRSPVLGNPGTNTGTLGLASASGGTATVTPPAIAGNTAFQLPTLAGTIPSTATSPIVLNPTTGAISCPTCTTGTAGALTAGVTTTSGFSAGQILYSDGTLLQAAGAVKATSIALGGAAIGSDALGATGTATISGTVTGAAFVPTANVVPTDGMYLNAAGQTAFSAGSTRIFFFNSTGLLMANASGATLSSSAAATTTPTLIPRRSDSGTGIGSSGTASLSLIATSIEQLRINNGSIYVGGAASGSNIAAVAPTISAALSTGTATNPDLVLQTGVATTSGAGQATATTALTIKGETQALLAPANLTIKNATAIPVGGTAGAGYLLSSTANFGTFFGSGAPTLAAAQGSLYLRSDGSAGARTYVNTNGTTGWVALADAGSAAVLSVTNVDGTLTISPNTGAVVASIALSHSNTWLAAQAIQSASATAFAVGLNGATNPAFQVDASTALQVAGLKVTGAVTGGTVAVAVVDSGSNANLTIDAKGSGTIQIGGTSTGAITLTRATTLSNALTYGGVTLSNSVTGTGSMVLSAAPTITGHPTIEGVTSTGATGTGNFVFSAAPTITGHPTIEGVTSTGATGTGNFVFATAPSVSSLTVTTAFTATGLVTLADLANMGANTVLSNWTSGSAVPAANTWPSCASDGVHALTYTNGTGVICTNLTTGGGGTVTSVTIAGTANNIAVSGTCTITTTGTCTIDLASARKTNPTTTTLTSGSGTYSTPANTLWIEITLVGGGSGGGGGNSATPSSNAGDTCWNTSGAACTTPVYDAGGGQGSSNTASGTGGAISGSGTCGWSVVGAAGNTSTNSISGVIAGLGGMGGVSTLGAAGPGAFGNATGSNAGTSSGSGGGGGGDAAAISGSSGYGGSAGATCHVIIGAPAATYTYAVGAGTNGAAGGTSGGAGGNGAAGKVIVIEHYN